MDESPKAEPLYKQALEILRKEHDDDHPDVATTLSKLATLYHDIAEYAKAEHLYTQALEIRKKVHGHEHPRVAKNLNCLALLYKSMGQYAKAEHLYRQALSLLIRGEVRIHGSGRGLR